MADQTLASLTAATPATGGLIYGTQGGADRKFTLSAAGAAVVEAATAADQRAALGLGALATQSDIAVGGTATGGASAGDLLVSDGSVVQKITPGSGVADWLATPTETNLKAATSGLAWLDTEQTFNAAQTLRVDALGTTTTAGLTLSNATSAASGSQQMSPSLTLVGQGWKTDATAASQTVSWRQEVLPVQGSAHPSAIWRLQGSVNGTDVANPHIQAPSNGPMIITGIAGVFGVLKLRHPDGYMGDNAVIAVDGAGGMDIAQTLLTNYYGTFFHQFGNGANYLQAYADASYSALASSFNAIWVGKSTTPQVFRVVNTFTSTTNWEAAVIDWQTASNTLRIGSDVGSGGGAVRDVQLIRGGAVKITMGANTTDHAQPVKLPSYTASGLPSASGCGEGSMAWVTDATSTTAYTAVSGGGSSKVLVISDGTNWIIH